MSQIEFIPPHHGDASYLASLAYVEDYIAGVCEMRSLRGLPLVERARLTRALYDGLMRRLGATEPYDMPVPTRPNYTRVRIECVEDAK